MLENILLFRLLVGLLGIVLVIWAVLAAVRTFVVPRGESVRLTSWTFQLVWNIFYLLQKRASTYEHRDRMLSLFAPLALLVFPVVVVILVMIGYACIYWALGVFPWDYAFTLSGSTMLTLGTLPFITTPITIIEFSEAIIGLGLVALLIAYLPTMYAAFSAREMAVTMLEVRAGAPPSAMEFILRMYRNRGLDEETLREFWREWEMWFTQLEESHNSFAALVFFRSQQPNRSWLTAAGAVLDAASLIDSTVDVPQLIDARLTIRAGYLALRSIADLMGIAYDRNPNQGDAISIGREEFDDVYDQLAEAGVPLRADRDQAWLDFSGWRVNYDTVLLRLARLIYAPYAMWSSDRSLPGDRQRWRTWQGLFRRFALK